MKFLYVTAFDAGNAATTLQMALSWKSIMSYPIRLEAMIRSPTFKLFAIVAMLENQTVYERSWRGWAAKLSHRIGLKASTPAKSFSLSVTTTQSFASATAATMVSSALRGRP